MYIKRYFLSPQGTTIYMHYSLHQVPHHGAYHGALPGAQVPAGVRPGPFPLHGAGCGGQGGEGGGDAREGLYHAG